MKIILLTTLLAMGGSLRAQTASLAVTIDKLESDKGTVHVTLRDSAQKIISEKDVPIKNNTAHVAFDSLAHGRYAVKVFHDENSNEKMDRTLLGIPTEGWGVSTDPKRGRGPVRFRNTLFDLKENKKITVTIRN
ncbi:DUF2141 domain-containing protein [Flavihumibacter sp. R14]|nr:DUF2141 domain-containing protein [Flavihumibacter soli]